MNAPFCSNLIKIDKISHGLPINAYYISLLAKASTKLKKKVHKIHGRRAVHSSVHATRPLVQCAHQTHRQARPEHHNQLDSAAAGQHTALNPQNDGPEWMRKNKTESLPIWYQNPSICKINTLTSQNFPRRGSPPHTITYVLTHATVSLSVTHAHTHAQTRLITRTHAHTLTSSHIHTHS